MKPLAIASYSIVSALGVGREATADALAAGRGGLTPRRFDGALMPGQTRPSPRGGPGRPAQPDRLGTAALDSWLGVVDAVDEVRLPAALADWDCRNNRLAELALASDDFAAAVARTAARVGSERVAVVVGTSTSGILQTEIAYRHRDADTGALPAWLHYAQTHDNASLARYVQRALALAGPAFVISTACSSGAKAFAAAARLIGAGLVDAAVVGGADSLCLTTLYGFHSLELLSRDVCRPWDARRSGLSLGEGASFALLEREPAAPMGWLLGCGESSDGHHMSAPHPDGAGAALAMRHALDDADLAAQDIGYINLHGTGTPNNDAAEDTAVCAVFGETVPVSSTKSATGHTLGAAGAVEAAITLLALEHGLVPAGLHLRERDPALRAHYVTAPLQRPLKAAASNSFGFGGSNACLVFGGAR